MRPEIMRPVMCESCVDIEVLQLSEGEERRCLDDMDAKDFYEAVVVEIEGILESEQAVAVAIHDAGVFNNVNVLWGPASGYVANDRLLEKTPIASKAYKQRGGLVHVRVRRRVPCWNWGEVIGRFGGCGEREIVDDWGRLLRNWSVKDFGRFCRLGRNGTEVFKFRYGNFAGRDSLDNEEGADYEEGDKDKTHDASSSALSKHDWKGQLATPPTGQGRQSILIMIVAMESCGMTPSGRRLSLPWRKSRIILPDLSHLSRSPIYRQ